MSWRRKAKFRYTTTEAEVAAFIEQNACVRDFLARYQDSENTLYEKSVGLARFFKYLRIVKKIELTPNEFLNLHLKKRAAACIEDRRCARGLALAYSRDNPDLKGKARNYVYTPSFCL